MITDAIMVKVCKVDPKNGSADFQTYIFAVCGFGGICGSITAIFLTEALKPYTTFFFYSFLNLFLIVFACYLNEGYIEKTNVKDNL